MRRRIVAALLALAVASCGPFGRRRPPAGAPGPAARPATPSIDSIRAIARGDSAAGHIPLPAIDTSLRRPGGGPPPEKPGERCILDLENTDSTRSQFIKDPVTQRYTGYIGGGVVGHCRGQDIRVTSDSAESYDQSQLYYLIGTVKYREKRVALDADRLSYYRAEERLVAEGNVRAVMQDSSTMTGPRAEYLRAVRGVRPLSRMNANGRPTLQFFERDSLGRRRGDPVVLVADNIIGEGDSLFTAWGRVTLDRSDISARGDSARLDNARQFSRLMKGPVIESKGSQPFTLRGRVVDLYGQSQQLDRVVAIDSANVVNQDIDLQADTIDLRMRTNKLQRAFAFGTGGAAATSAERNIFADSLDVLMPDQHLRELHAIRNAFAESDPDTLRIQTRERDWLRGDTILAHFDTLAAGDTTTRPRIHDLVASGSASSYYQVPNNQGDKSRPGVNYVRGRQILVDFADREVQTVTVVDQASGIYLEPRLDTLPAKPGPKPRRPAAKRPGTRPAPPTRPRRP
jgi:hypothetical protein